MSDESLGGRGAQATSDMKVRIAVLTARGYSMERIVETLWRRHAKAEREGYRYEHAAGTGLVRPDGL